MNKLTTRRRFIEITPFAGVALLAACSKAPEPAAAPAVAAAPPAPAPAPAPEPAPAAAAAAPAPAAATTASLPMVDEKDATAMALGYVAEATRADKTKFKNYVDGSQCSGCALYMGKPGDAAGPCPLYAGKSVSSKGWCSSWVKKA